MKLKSKPSWPARNRRRYFGLQIRASLLLATFGRITNKEFLRINKQIDRDSEKADLKFGRLRPKA